MGYTLSTDSKVSLIPNSKYGLVKSLGILGPRVQTQEPGYGVSCPQKGCSWPENTQSFSYCATGPLDVKVNLCPNLGFCDFQKNKFLTSSDK